MRVCCTFHIRWMTRERHPLQLSWKSSSVYGRTESGSGVGEARAAAGRPGAGRSGRTAQSVERSCERDSREGGEDRGGAADAGTGTRFTAGVRSPVRETGGTRSAMLGQKRDREGVGGSGLPRVGSVLARDAARANGAGVGRTAGYGRNAAEHVGAGAGDVHGSAPGDGAAR